MHNNILMKIELGQKWLRKKLALIAIVAFVIWVIWAVSNVFVICFQGSGTQDWFLGGLFLLKFCMLLEYIKHIKKVWVNFEKNL